MASQLREAIRNARTSSGNSDSNGVGKGIDESGRQVEGKSEGNISRIQSSNVSDERDKRVSQGNFRGHGSKIRGLVDDSFTFKGQIKENKPAKQSLNILTKDNEIEDKVKKFASALPNYFYVLDQMLWEMSGSSNPIWSNAMEEECLSIARSFVKLSTFWQPAAIIVDNVIFGKDHIVTAAFFGMRFPSTLSILNPINAYKRYK